MSTTTTSSTSTGTVQASLIPIPPRTPEQLAAGGTLSGGANEVDGSPPDTFPVSEIVGISAAVVLTGVIVWALFNFLRERPASKSATRTKHAARRSDSGAASSIPAVDTGRQGRHTAERGYSTQEAASPIRTTSSTAYGSFANVEMQALPRATGGPGVAGYSAVSQQPNSPLDASSPLPSPSNVMYAPIMYVDPQTGRAAIPMIMQPQTHQPGIVTSVPITSSHMMPLSIYSQPGSASTAGMSPQPIMYDYNSFLQSQMPASAASAANSHQSFLGSAGYAGAQITEMYMQQAAGRNGLQSTRPDAIQRSYISASDARYSGISNAPRAGAHMMHMAGPPAIASNQIFDSNRISRQGYAAMAANQGSQSTFTSSSMELAGSARASAVAPRSSVQQPSEQYVNITNTQLVSSPTSSPQSLPSPIGHHSQAQPRRQR